MKEYLVYYKKGNGEIIQRNRSTLPEYKIGESTSMGWLVMDIKYVLNGNIYDTVKDYNLAIKKLYRFDHTKRNIRNAIRNNMWKFIFILYSALTFTVLVVKL